MDDHFLLFECNMQENKLIYNAANNFLYMVKNGSIYRISAFLGKNTMFDSK